MFVHSIKILNLSLNKLKTIAKSRGIKGYKSMSEERLLSILNESKSAKESEKNFDDARIDFNKLRDRLTNTKIKEIRKDLYRIENKKNLFTEKIKKIEKNFSKLKKYHDYDDTEFRETRDIKNLFDLSIDEDYYKPIKTKDAFNSNYIEYESKEDKSKNLSTKEYFNIITSYLRDIINDDKTQGEWKIQLTVIINFISSKDSDEIRTMRRKNNNIEIMMGNETDEIIAELFESLLQKCQED